jgi:hypothetical protein
LSANATTAAQLNQRREAACRVDEAVIRNMAAKLEPPDPLANTWERFSFTIPVSDGADTNFGNIFILQFCPFGVLYGKQFSNSRPSLLIQVPKFNYYHI